jgi:hypothetical protein
LAQHKAEVSGEAGDDTTGHRGPRPRRSQTRRVRPIDILVALSLLVVAVAISAIGTYRAPSLSAYDEWTHIDYAWNVAHGSIPSAGAKVAPEVLQEWSCRSQENAADQLPACGELADASAYPLRGENYNFSHPPLYYAVTAALASVGAAAPFDLSFVTIARLSGGIWLAAALVGLYGLLVTLRVRRGLAVCAAVVLASVPSVAHASSIVTNDAPAALSGVAALAVLVRFSHFRNYGWLFPFTVTTLVVSTKVMNSLALLTVAGIALLMALSAARKNRHTSVNLLKIAASIVVPIMVVYFGWTTFQASRGVSDWSSPVQGINTSPVEGNPFDEWLPTWFSTFGITQDYWLQSSLTSFAVVAAAKLLSVLFTAGPFMNVSLHDAGDSRRLLGWTALAGAAATPVVVQLQTYLGNEYFFRHVSSRYGITLLPITIAALATVAQARGWRVSPVLIATSTIAALLLSFLGVM